MHLIKRAILKSFGSIVALAAYGCLAAGLLVLTGEGLSQVDGRERYALIEQTYTVIKHLEAPALGAIHRTVPVVFNGVDAAPYLVAVSLLALWMLCLSEKNRVQFLAWRLDADKQAADRDARTAREHREALAAIAAADQDFKKKALAMEAERVKAIAESNARAQAEARRRAEHEMEEARLRAEHDAHARAEQQARVREAMLRAEAAEAAKRAAEQAHRAASEQAKAAEIARQHEAQRQAELTRQQTETLARQAAEEQALLAARLKAQREAEERARAAAPAPVPAPAPAPQAAPAQAESERERLLEAYAMAKRKLEEQKKNLSFLAIDVVNSTGMKLGEDAALAERDFRQYKKLVERVIAANKGLKAAWTPDGVMVCFASVQNAVQAAQELIRSLETFNRQVKTIKADFKVRCGINAGAVMFDESVRMEEMADRNIDIAGHMQKYADANTIYVGAHAIEGVRAHGFRPAQKQVDGHDVYEWRPEAAAL